MSLIKWTEDGGHVTLGLPDDLDLPMASALVDSLRHAFAVGDSVVVEAGAVDRVSTACVQALVAASRVAEQSHQKFTIATPSETLTNACQDLGLQPWLKQWSHV